MLNPNQLPRNTDYIPFGEILAGKIAIFLEQNMEINIKSHGSMDDNKTFT